MKVNLRDVMEMLLRGRFSERGTPAEAMQFYAFTLNTLDYFQARLQNCEKKEYSRRHFCPSA